MTGSKQKSHIVAGRAKTQQFLYSDFSHKRLDRITWTTKEKELKEADRDYRNLFESDYYEPWFSAF